MYKVDAKITSDVIKLLERTVNEAAIDPYVIENVEYAIDVFKEEYAEEERIGKNEGLAKVDLLDSVASSMGFSIAHDDALRVLAHTLASALIIEIEENKANPKEIKKEKQNHNITPSLIDNDLDRDAYENVPTRSYQDSFDDREYPSYQTPAPSHNKELDDPRLKRVLRKR